MSTKRNNPRYPVFVISKGRSDRCLTARELTRIGVPFTLVVEPQEYDLYRRSFPAASISATPFSNLGQGSIPARNYVWDLAVASGAKRHWILDDNISAFYRFNNSRKILVEDGTIFRCAEDFVDRYANVEMAGFNYSFFMLSTNPAPYRLNVRIYSCILLDNACPLRWRGRYNEDTDLSLRILKRGKCTILFNAFLCNKMATMTMKGGNTDELYKGDGRLQMARSLAEQHPDCVTVGRRYNRFQHVVRYGKLRENRLIRIKTVPDGVDNYGMVLRYYGDGRCG